MTARLYTVATAPFEAARQVAILPEGHRCRRWHGHSFLARARAQLPPGWAPFHGAETDELAERLAAAVAPLDYQRLNDRLPVPTDENIARSGCGRGWPCRGSRRWASRAPATRAPIWMNRITPMSGGGSGSRPPISYPTFLTGIPAGGCTVMASK